MSETDSNRKRNRGAGEEDAQGGAAFQAEAAEFAELVKKGGETNSQVVDVLVRANRDKNKLVNQSAEMAVAAQESSVKMTLELVKARREKEKAQGEAFRERIMRQRLQQASHLEKVNTVTKGQKLAVAQLEAKLHMKDASVKATEESFRKLHHDALVQLENIQVQRSENHSGVQERELRQELDCVTLDRNTLQLRLQTQEEQLYNHRCEVRSLLSLIQQLSQKAEGFGPLQQQKTKLDILVRRLESKLTAEQIMEAALPDDGAQQLPDEPQKAGALRRLGSKPPNPQLRTAAPTLWAHRTLDFNELTIAQVVGEWVDGQKEIDSLRADLDRVREERRVAHERNMELSRTVDEERIHRKTVQEELDRLHRDGRIMPQQQWGAAGAPPAVSQAADTLRQLQTERSELITTRITLTTQLEAARVKNHDFSAEIETLKMKLAAVEKQAQESEVASTVAQLRVMYEQDLKRFDLINQQTQAKLVKSELEVKNRFDEVQNLKAALDSANAAMTELTGERTAALVKLQQNHRDASAQQVSYFRNLSESVKERSELLKAQFASVGPTKKSEPITTVCDEAMTTLVEVEEKINKMSQDLHKCITSLAESSILSGSADEATRVGVMQAQFSTNLASFVKLLSTQTEVTEDARLKFMKQKIEDGHTIESLKTDLEAAQLEVERLKADSAKMASTLEAVSHDTAETVLMRPVHFDEVDFEKLKEDLATWETKYNAVVEENTRLRQGILESKDEVRGVQGLLSDEKLNLSQALGRVQRLQKQKEDSDAEARRLYQQVIESENALTATLQLQEAAAGQGGEEGDASPAANDSNNSTSSAGEVVANQQQAQLSLVISVLGGALQEVVTLQKESLAASSSSSSTTTTGGVAVAENNNSNNEGEEGDAIDEPQKQQQKPILPKKVEDIVDTLKTLWERVHKSEELIKKSSTTSSGTTTGAQPQNSTTTVVSSTPQTTASNTGVSQQQYDQLQNYVKDLQQKTQRLNQEKSGAQSSLVEKDQEIKTLAETVRFLKEKEEKNNSSANEKLQQVTRDLEKEREKTKQIHELSKLLNDKMKHQAEAIKEKDQKIFELQQKQQQQESS